jgi:2-polyprenyl-6-methoxyphenol hydroxylase-like FAD-dependent oxidoreductase
MSPQLGQGVNLALVDAHTLTHSLATHRDVDGALAAYERDRRAQTRYYATASRLLTPLFQSALSPLAPPRDHLAHPASGVPWLRRQMLASLAGVKRGLLSSDPIP